MAKIDKKPGNIVKPENSFSEIVEEQVFVAEEPQVFVRDPSLDEKKVESFLSFDFYLVVKNPFNNYKRGDQIFTDADIQKVIDTHNLPNCLKVKRK